MKPNIRYVVENIYKFFCKISIKTITSIDLHAEIRQYMKFQKKGEVVNYRSMHFYDKNINGFGTYVGHFWYIRLATDNFKLTKLRGTTQEKKQKTHITSAKKRCHFEYEFKACVIPFFVCVGSLIHTLSNSGYFNR